MLQIKQANPDVLFAYLTEEEGARLLRELKKQGFNKPIVGETTIIGQKVIELAGRRGRRRPRARRTDRGRAAGHGRRRSTRSTWPNTSSAAITTA